MKNILLLSILFLSFSSCNKNNDLLPLKLKSAPVTELEVPESFQFGETYNLNITYNLPSSCYRFFNIDYVYNGRERDINILIYEDTKAICPQVTVLGHKIIPIKVLQHEDYTFNIWKGKDDSGKDIIESIVVPVID
ncbi:MAG: hypothetical protein QM486_02660 [Flavobacteriaceae bacterium]